ncbi:MAG: hypothetical protein GYA36_20490 [Veillonellaceae bacterium]|nr:hypothetical protein [Veillonellaceae bacterium]
MDLTDTIQPKSDQLDAVDLVGGPRTFTIERLTAGNAEQPVNVHLREFPRPWRPSKSMRRVLVAAWGPDGAQYAGRRLRLFMDPTVMFGGIAVGGTRISHMSHIDKTLKVSLLIKRGKSEIYTVEPLIEDVPAAPPQPSVEEIAAAGEEQLKAWWQTADEATQALIRARVAELRGDGAS